MNVKTPTITDIKERTEEVIMQLLAVWESAVRETHDFLTEQEIMRIKEYIPTALRAVRHLSMFVDETETPIAFIGVEDGKIEMLFVHPKHRGQGVGKQLIAYAKHHHAAREVTVNEQNPQAIGFYEHLGFHTYKRTPHDEQGAPYPLLYMRLR